MSNENKLGEMSRNAKKIYKPEAAGKIVNLLYAVAKR